MIKLPSIPTGSKIEVQYDFNQTTLCWKNPRGGLMRYAYLLFLIAWMGGWAVGETVALRAVVMGEGRAFILFWLIGWTVGGLFCAMTIFKLARPSRPEKITLDSLCLLYEPGTDSINPMSRHTTVQSSLEIFKLNKSVRAAKTDISNLKIDRVGERQRLSFDCEAKRIEIGQYLTEPEREWLHGVLQSWRSS